jgi:hypothetical protein
LVALDKDAGGKWYLLAFRKRDVSKLKELLRGRVHPHGKLSPTSTLRFPFELCVRKLAEHDERAAAELSTTALSFPRIEEPVGREDEWEQQALLLWQELQRLRQEIVQHQTRHTASQWTSWENVTRTSPAQTPRFHRVSIPRHQRAYNPILLEEVDVHEWLTDPGARDENVLLVVATDPRRAVQWVPITRTHVRSMAQQATFYKCPVADSFQDLDRTKPLYSLRSLGAHGGMVSLAAIQAAQQDLTQRIWRVGSEIDHLPSVASYEVVALNASRVSAAHCQAGQASKEYEFTSSPWTPPRGSLGGKKRGRRSCRQPHNPSSRKRMCTRGPRRRSRKGRRS